MSYLRTAILLAGLTGLFMGVGYPGCVLINHRRCPLHPRYRRAFVQPQQMSRWARHGCAFHSEAM
jgi:hypothetical protein